MAHPSAAIIAISEGNSVCISCTCLEITAWCLFPSARVCDSTDSTNSLWVGMRYRLLGNGTEENKRCGLAQSTLMNSWWPKSKKMTHETTSGHVQDKQHPHVDCPRSSGKGWAPSQEVLWYITQLRFQRQEDLFTFMTPHWENGRRVEKWVFCNPMLRMCFC